jgi:hypothetical protein
MYGTGRWDRRGHGSRSGDASPQAIGHSRTSRSGAKAPPTALRPLPLTPRRSSSSLRVTPPTRWIRDTTSLPSASTSSVCPRDHVLGAGDRLGGEHSLGAPISSEASAAAPTSVWTSTYASTCTSCDADLRGGRPRAPARRSPGRATTARDRDPSTRPGPRCSRHPGCLGSLGGRPVAEVQAVDGVRPLLQSGCRRRRTGLAHTPVSALVTRYRTGFTPPPGGA